MTFVHKAARRLTRPRADALLALASAVVALTSCKASTGPRPVASVSVTPTSASIQVGQLMMPSAVAKDGGGNPLTGRLMSWSSSNALVATVTSVGLVTGIATGSATITATSEGQSGMSTITVTAAGSCLDQVGPLTTLTGVSASPYIEENLADNTKIDAREWQSRLPVALDDAVKIGGSAGACWSGGEMLGAWPPNTIYDVMHSKYPMVVGGSGGAQNIRVENVRVFNYGQGIGFDNQGDRYWRLTGCYIKYDRQAIENDFLNSGTIDDCFIEDAQTFLSSRAYTTTQDGSNNVVIISNSLVSLSAHDAAYLSGLPSHNAFVKWSGGGYTPGIGPKVAIYRTVFRVDSDSREQEGAGEYMEP
ncbi:MAG: Ig-like domain-containing protein, partial [Gemmatimonadota bacterium]